MPKVQLNCELGCLYCLNNSCGPTRWFSEIKLIIKHLLYFAMMHLDEKNMNVFVNGLY